MTVWVLVQIEWTNPPTYVCPLPGGSQFTQNILHARKFETKELAEDFVERICYAWPHQPKPVAVEMPEGTRCDNGRH